MLKALKVNNKHARRAAAPQLWVLPRLKLQPQAHAHIVKSFFFQPSRLEIA